MQEGVVLSSYIMKCCVSIYLAPKHRSSYLLRKPPFLWILKKFKSLSFENRFLNANVPARANPKVTGNLRRESLSVGSGKKKNPKAKSYLLNQLYLLLSPGHYCTWVQGRRWKADLYANLLPLAQTYTPGPEAVIIVLTWKHLPEG